MSATHEPDIDLDFILAAALIQAASFAYPTIFCVDVAYSGGERYKTYSNATEIDADADLSSDQKIAAKQFFGQAHKPDGIHVVDVDITGGETYAEAYTDWLAQGEDFWAITLQSNVDTEIAALAAAVRTNLDTHEAFVFGETASADALTSGLPAAYAAESSNENLGLVYHNPITPEYAAQAVIGDRLGFDVDQKTPGFTATLAGVGADSITPTQRNEATANNINTVLPYYSAAARMKPGVSITGRPISQMLSKAWLRARLGEALAQLELDYESRGEQIPVSRIGQEIVAGEVAKVYGRGVSLGKLVSFEIVEPYPTITAADLAAQRIPLTVRAVFVTGAVTFNITTTLSQS